MAGQHVFSTIFHYLCPQILYTEVMMKHHFVFLLAVVATILVVAGCTGKNTQVTKRSDRKPSPSDTTYTKQAAMMVYDYDPVRALQIIDSAVIVGNLSDFRADKTRAQIYSRTGIAGRFDSLMHWTANARLDSAKAIAERLLRHDSVKNRLEEQQDMLEMLAYTARMQEDTLTWLLRSRQLVDVCRRQGAETEALRNEAELGAALYSMGRQAEGMAMMDSVIDILPSSSSFRFNELDALVIALKRKIGVMITTGQSAEILPLARRIVTLLDDYERHPDQYHDGTYREPPAEKRDDYIRFYRSQAQNFIATAYAALGQTDDMKATFERLEDIVRDAEAREHHARYAALEHQMEAERQRADAQRNALIAWSTAILALFALCFALYYWRQKHIVAEKNRYLARQMDEAMAYREKYQKEKDRVDGERLRVGASAEMDFAAADEAAEPTDTADASSSEAQLFAHIVEVIAAEQLYLDSACDRQMLTDRFQLSKERLGSLFAQYSEAANISAFINALRLDHASRLLTSQPDIDIRQVASQSGFSSHQYFSNCFKQRFGLSPTDYRRAKHF